MCAAKSKRSTGSRLSRLCGPVVRPFMTLGPSVFVFLVLMIALTVGLVLAWRKWGEEVTRRPEFTLQGANVIVTPPPPWIKTDVRARMIHDHRLTELSVLDPHLTVSIYRAFSLHPWVARVNRVSKKASGKLLVELEYRQPIAMVEVPGGLHPIDSQSIVLPAEDFLEVPDQVRLFPRIVADGAVPSGPAGTPWGDARILGAARIATAFGSRWAETGLYRIVAYHTDGEFLSVEKEPSFDLVSRTGTRVRWGHTPGKEATGESQASLKLKRLFQIISEHGSLDGTTFPEIDLRFPTELPETAFKPTPTITQ